MKSITEPPIMNNYPGCITQQVANLDKCRGLVGYSHARSTTSSVDCLERLLEGVKSSLTSPCEHVADTYFILAICILFQTKKVTVQSHGAYEGVRRETRPCGSKLMS